MLSWLKQRANEVVVGTISGLIVAALGAALPLAITIFTFISGSSFPSWVTLGVALGWTISGVIGLIWYIVHKRTFARRMLNITTALCAFDMMHLKNIPIHPPILNEDQAKREIENILNALLEEIAYRIPSRQKAASFIVTRNENNVEFFELYACRNYRNQAQLATIIKDKLPTTRGLAAQAIRERGCIVLPDSSNPPRHITWEIIDPPSVKPRFQGHVAVAVQILDRGKITPIGALCLDFEPSWQITEDEKDVLNLFADKIALIWKLSRP